MRLLHRVVDEVLDGRVQPHHQVPGQRVADGCRLAHGRRRSDHRRVSAGQCSEGDLRFHLVEGPEAVVVGDLRSGAATGLLGKPLVTVD